MTCRIEKLVCEAVATLDEGASVQDAVDLMVGRDLGSLVVTRDSQVVGLFTERDLLRRVVGSRMDPQQLRVGEVCSRNLVTISHDSSCEEAIKKMQANLCRRLLVYRGSRFDGLVNLPDVANALAEQGGRKDLAVNLIGAVTLTLVIAVIGMLIYQLPQMLQLVDQVSGR